MATKAKAQKIATSQGASFETGYSECGEFYVDIALPQGKMWDNPYRLGQVYQEKDRHESMSEFWDNVLHIIDSAVIDEN